MSTLTLPPPTKTSTKPAAERLPTKPQKEARSVPVQPVLSPAQPYAEQPIADLLTDIPTEPIWRMSVAQYHRLIRLGVLTDDDPIELLEGWLVQKMPKKPPHRVATGLLHEELTLLLARAQLLNGWHVASQEPLTTGDSEPEPDIAVVRGQLRDYLKRHPGPKDVALVVEVADATVRRELVLSWRAWQLPLQAVVRC